MDRYLKYVICRYPCIGGQIYMSSQGLAIQIMSKDGYLIFLDCRARQLFAYLIESSPVTICCPIAHLLCVALPSAGRWH